MFESFLAVPLHFTVEFLGFLVAVGASLLALARPDLVPGPRSNRLSVALGFGALALAQVLHGGGFEVGSDSGAGVTDGGEIIVGLKALGFALILIGVVGAMRPVGAGAAAILGFEIEDPLVLAPAGVALLVAFAAYAVGRHPASRNYRHLGTAMLFFALSEVLTSGAPDATFGTGTTEGLAYAAHGIRAVGDLMIAAWFWSAIVSSIRIRFVASFGALLVAVILALSTALTGVISNNVENEELDRVRSQASAAAQSIKEDANDLFAQVRSAETFTGTITGLARGRDPQLLARLVRELGLFNQDFIVVDPAGGRSPAFEGRGPQQGPQGGPSSLSRELRLGLIGTPIYLSVATGEAPFADGVVRFNGSQSRDVFAAVIATQSLRVGGRVVGSVTIGDWLDESYMERLDSNLSARVSIVAAEEVIASSFRENIENEVAVPEELRSETIFAGAASAQGIIGDKAYFNGYASVQEGGRPVATVVVSSEATVVATTRSQVNRLLFLAAMVVGAVALVLAWVSGKRITQPIQDLTATAQAVREGDLNAQAPVAGNDEVGQLGETFNEMTASLLKMTSDLRTAAREEHALRSRIETIIQSMADGLVAVDAQGSILAFNREAEHLTGIPSEVAVGRPISEVVRARDGQGVPVALPIHSLSEGSMGGIFLESKDGDPVPIAITSAVLRSEEEQISGAVAVIRDMTREREVERMKSEFLSNISHELRTPLTPIKGYAEILQRKEVPRDKMLQFVRGILESTGRLERIVELLVDFAAMEAGRMAPKSSHVDVGEMLDELAERWNERSAQHEITTDVPSPAPRIIGDERLLKRSLEEVLDNAVKFSPRGGRIVLEAHGVGSGRGAPGRVEITISDEGIGILPEDLPRIFSDFQQLDGSETRTYGGLGLGLAYVRRIAQAHDGEVRVESEPDAGTRLTIVLPAAGQDAEEENPPRTAQTVDN